MYPRSISYTCNTIQYKLSFVGTKSIVQAVIFHFVTFDKKQRATNADSLSLAGPSFLNATEFMSNNSLGGSLNHVCVCCVKACWRWKMKWGTGPRPPRRGKTLSRTWRGLSSTWGVCLLDSDLRCLSPDPSSAVYLTCWCCRRATTCSATATGASRPPAPTR